MNNASSETSTTAELADNGDGSGSDGGSGLAVGLSIGGVLIAAILVFIVAYRFFSRRKDSDSDSYSDNNNLQRVSMNSENFSHVTNLKKLEPMEIKTGKALPKRTKPTLDEKRGAGKADDLSDVDLSLFSGDGQLNPAFVDDEELDHSHHGNVKKSATVTDGNVVVLRLEGIVKFDVSQMVGIDKNIALSLEDRNSGEVQKIVASNGDVKTYQLLDKDTGEGTSKPKQDVVGYKAKPIHFSENVTDPERKVDYQTVDSTNSKMSSSNVAQHRSDVAEDIRPGTSKAKLPTIITTSVDEEDVIQVITEDTSSCSNERNAPTDKSTSVAVVIEDSKVSDNSSSHKNEDKHVSVKEKSPQDRNFSVIEKSIVIEDEVHRRKYGGRGKEITTIYIGDTPAPSVTDWGDKPASSVTDRGDRPAPSVTDRGKSRHAKIVFKSNPKPENSSGKSEHRKRQLESEPSLKGKDMNVPVKAQSGGIGQVKKSRNISSDNLTEHLSQSYPDRPSQNNVIHKGKTIPTKPVLTRQMSTYEIPWDLTDVGALLLQVNSIAESDEMRVDKVS